MKMITPVGGIIKRLLYSSAKFVIPAPLEGRRILLSFAIARRKENGFLSVLAGNERKALK